VFTLRGNFYIFQADYLWLNWRFREVRKNEKTHILGKFQIYESFGKRMRITAYFFFFLNDNPNFSLPIRVDFFFTILLDETCFSCYKIDRVKGSQNFNLRVVCFQQNFSHFHNNSASLVGVWRRMPVLCFSRPPQTSWYTACTFYHSKLRSNRNKFNFFGFISFQYNVTAYSARIQVLQE